jgi:hypothetical protein
MGGVSVTGSEDYGSEDALTPMQNATLFDLEKKTYTPQRVTITCSGCTATATVHHVNRRCGVHVAIPLGWGWCGSQENGQPARWCAQCLFERRHEVR